MFQYVYGTLFPKYFCRVDDFGIRNKLAFEVAHAGYQNQKKELWLLYLQHWHHHQRQQQQQQIVSIKQEHTDEKETVEVKSYWWKKDLSSVPLETNKWEIVDKAKKNLLKKKKRDEKKRNF